MKKFLFTAMFVCSFVLASFAQPRPVETGTERAKPAPATFEAKYEGGLFGYSQKENGTLKFDDENERIVFFGKDQKERFGIPYKSLMVVSPQSRAVTSNTGNVVSNIPLPGAGILGGFIKEKRQYMLVQFNDPDAEVSGVTTFKVSSKELLDSVIQTLGEKAKLKQRGDGYFRPKKAPVTEI